MPRQTGALFGIDSVCSGRAQLGSSTSGAVCVCAERAITGWSDDETNYHYAAGSAVVNPFSRCRARRHSATCRASLSGSATLYPFSRPGFLRAGPSGKWCPEPPADNARPHPHSLLVSRQPPPLPGFSHVDIRVAFMCEVHDSRIELHTLFLTISSVKCYLGFGRLF